MRKEVKTMKTVMMALAMVGLLTGPALANQCPLLVKQIVDATAGKTDDASKKAATMATEAKALHDAASTPIRWPRPRKRPPRSSSSSR